MSTELKDFDIKGLDGLEDKINKQYKQEILTAKLISSMPFCVFIIFYLEALRIGESKSGLLWLFVICTCISSIVYFTLRISIISSKKLQLDEFNQLVLNPIKVKYKISKDGIHVYLDKVESLLIREVEFSDIDESVLDFENGVLRLKLDRGIA